MAIRKDDPRNIESHQRMPHQKLTLGQKAADTLTEWGGSWQFIGGLIIVLLIWAALNLYLIMELRWDPYPFILLNLFLSCLAALQAPVILMSQNRTAERDHIKAERDYAINRKAEREIENMQADLDEIKSMISKAKNTRDKAIITMLYESGARIGEFINLRIRDLEFHDYGVHVSINGTKNKYSKRKVLLITSLPAISKWINEHANKDNPESFLWVSFNHKSYGKCLTYNGITRMIAGCIKRAGIKGKKFNCHNFRQI